MGDPDLRLQVLLPVEPAFDLAMNVFTYQPGGTLPQVEIHLMEHGLLMLDGAGVYRLGDDYHPVQAGDIIWMAPYCPQWFVAMGKQPAVVDYFLEYVKEEGAAQHAPSDLVAKLETTLDELKVIAAKPTLGKEDVERIHSATGEVLALL